MGTFKLLTDRDYLRTAEQLEVEVAALLAVAEVESDGSGFLESGLPKILFEGHLFHRFTAGQYDQIYPDISYPKWTKKYYLGGQREYERFLKATKLDRFAAIRAASWGKFQIIGNNYREAGFVSLEDFYYAMQQDEREHLKAFVNFVKSKKLVESLRKKDWVTFAYHYNGPKYKENKYDEKMRKAYEAARGKT